MSILMRLFIYFGVSLILPSCMSTLLNTNVHHVANLHEKTDVSIQAGIAAPSGTVSASVAYAPSKVLALSAAVQSNLQGDVYGQTGIGVYRRIKKHNFFENFIAIGYGHGMGAPHQFFYPKQYVDNLMDTKPSLEYHNKDNHGKYVLIANQVSFSAANRNYPNIMYGVSLKAGFLYSNVYEKVMSGFWNNLFNDSVTSGYTQMSSNFISPLTFIKFGGGKYVYTYFFQMQFTENLMFPSVYENTSVSFPLISTGCVVQFNNKKEYMYGRQPLAPHVSRSEIQQYKRFSVMLAAGYSEREKEILYHTFPQYDSISFTEPRSESTPVMAIGAEYQVNPWVSVAVQAGFQRTVGSYSDFIMLRPNGTVTYPYKIYFTHNELSAGIKPLLHIVHRAQFEMYCGALAGVVYNSVNSIPTPDGLSATRVHPYSTGYKPVWQIIPLGLRYFPMPQYGCSVEFAYPHLSFIQLGLHYRM